MTLLSLINALMMYITPSSAVGYITSPFGIWFPVVILGTIAIIGVIAMIYMFSRFAGSNQVAVWARAKMYDVFLSLILIFIFLFVTSFIFTINFQGAYGLANLVPPACQSPALPATDIFSLAICNIYQFNSNVANINNFIYIAALRSSFVPAITINGTALIQDISDIEGVGGSAELQIPTAMASATGDALDLLYTMFVLSQVQLLLLSSSLLFFSLFMSIGLIARLFVITRSFGGALIALAIGLGIIYPVIVSFTYGFVNVAIAQDSNICANVAGLQVCQNIYGASEMTVAVGGILGMVGGILINAAGPSIPYVGSAFNLWLNGFIKIVGLDVIGLAIIPFLTFIILDVFILDFSQAVGERMDFMSLLGNII